MVELTPEELANLSPEEQAEYLKLVEQEKQYQQTLQPSAQPEEPKKPAQEEKGFLEKTYSIVKPFVKPIAGMAAAAEKGFEQGLLSGGAEEARAGALSVSPDIDYKTALKEQEAAFKKSEEERPISTFAGELAGSVAQGAALTAATSGLALPAAIANAMSKISKINKAAQLAFKIGKPVTRIAKTAALGAAEGAVQGVLRSDKSLYEQAKEGFKEAESGAKSGAVFGAGLETAGKVLKGTAGKVGDVISSKIDEGSLSPSIRPIREAWRLGQRKIGFSSEESLRRPVKNLMKVIEKKIQPKIQNSMREVKDLSDYILQNVPKKIEIEDVVESGVSKLKSEGHLDANKFADYISNKYKAIKQSVPPSVDIYGQQTGAVPKISLMDAKLFIRDLQNELRSKPQTHASFQDTINKITKQIDSMIDSNLTDADAVEAVLKDPEQTINFFNILRKSSPENLAQKELQNVTGILQNSKALEKAKKTSEKIAGKYKNNIDSVMKNLDELPTESKINQMSQLLENPKSRAILEEASKNLGPVKILDSKMKNILSAQELLTGELFPKTDVEKAEQVMEIFRIISGQTKEGVSADVSRATYDKALTLLGTAFPEVAEDLNKIVKPITDDLFMVRYLHGIGFDPALKDTAAVQKVLGPGSKLAAQGANILAQTLESAKKGVAGPIPFIPSTTILRPTKSALESSKTMLESIMKKVNPEAGPIEKMISERLDDALKSTDEGRRLSILNILMQYSKFRNMVKEEEATNK